MKIFVMLAIATTTHNFRMDYDNPTMYDEFIFILKTFILVLIPFLFFYL